MVKWEISSGKDAWHVMVEDLPSSMSALLLIPWSTSVTRLISLAWS